MNSKSEGLQEAVFAANMIQVKAISKTAVHSCNRGTSYKGHSQDPLCNRRLEIPNTTTANCS